MRLGYREPFDYPLSAYLNRIQWVWWGGEEDTPRLIDELQHAIAGQLSSIGSASGPAQELEASAQQGAADDANGATEAPRSGEAGFT